MAAVGHIPVSTADTAELPQSTQPRRGELGGCVAKPNPSAGSVAPEAAVRGASRKLSFALRLESHQGGHSPLPPGISGAGPEADFEMRANCAPSNLMEQQRQRGAGFLIYAPMMHQAPSFGAWWTRPRCFSRWQASLTVPGVHRSAAAAMQSSALRCRQRQRLRGSVAAVRPGP